MGFRIHRYFGVRTMDSALFQLESAGQSRSQPDCVWLLCLFERRSILDGLRLLEPRQKIYSENVVVFCAGWIPLVLL